MGNVFTATKKKQPETTEATDLNQSNTTDTQDSKQTNTTGKVDSKQSDKTEVVHLGQSNTAEVVDLSQSNKTEAVHLGQSNTTEAVSQSNTAGAADSKHSIMTETVPGKLDGLASDFKRSLHNMPRSIEQASNYLHANLFPRNLCEETWQVPEKEFKVAMKNVEDLIEREWSLALSMSLDDTHAR